MIETGGDDIGKMIDEMKSKLQSVEPIATAIQDEYFNQNAGVVRPGHKMNLFQVSFNVVTVGTLSESFFEMIVFDEDQLWENVISPWLNEG